MRYILICGISLCLGMAQINAQILQTAADTSFLVDLTGFPTTDATFTLSFSATMLDLDKRPEKKYKKTPKQLIEDLKKDTNDAEAYTRLFEHYRAESQPKLATLYLGKALEKSGARYEADNKNIENAEELAVILSYAGRYDGVVQVWQEFVTNNPDNAKGWASLALFLLQFSELEKAQECLLKAYELDPSLREVYVGEILHQFYQLIIKIGAASDPEATGSPDFWEIDDSFIRKAMEEHPKLETPKMALYAVKTVVLLFETALSAADKIGSMKPFKLKMSKEGKKQAKEIEAYMQKLLDEDFRNQGYAYRCLAVLDILKGDLELAEKRVRQMETFWPPDREMYKLLSFAHLPGNDWSGSLKYLSKAQDLSDVPADYLTIARMYFELGKYDEAFLVFEKHSAKFQYAVSQSDYSSVYGLGAVYIQQGRFEFYTSLIKDLDQIILASKGMPIKDPATCAWYRSLAFILEGDKDSAKEMLDFLTESGGEALKEKAEKMLKRFF